MIGRLVAWIRKSIAELVDLLAAIRNYSTYDQAVVRATTCGVRVHEIHDTLCHTELGSPYGCGARDVVVIESLCLLAAVGVPYEQRREILLGMAIRYRACFGPGAFPTHLLHNCTRALSIGIGRGYFQREDLFPFIEAFPQFRSEHSNNPTPQAVSLWFLLACPPRHPNCRCITTPLDN